MSTIHSLHGHSRHGDAPTWPSVGPTPFPGLAKIAVLLIATGSLEATGCGPSGGHHAAGEYRSQIEELAVRKNRPDPLVESQTRGREIYMHYCQICHGAEGRGDGFNSGNLAVTPRDFGDQAFWKRATKGHLITAVTEGGTAVGKSVLMPAWGKTLSMDQVRDVVTYLQMVPSLVGKALAQQEENGEEEGDDQDE